MIAILWKPGVTMKQIKVEMVRQLLLRYRGNKMRTARVLKISLRTVRNYVRDYPELSEFRIEVPTCLKSHSPSSIQVGSRTGKRTW